MPIDAPPPGEVTRAEEFSRPRHPRGWRRIGGIITEDTRRSPRARSSVTSSPDRVEVSGIFQIAYTRIEDDFGNDDSQTVGSLIVEPSYHYPVGADVLAAGGVGLGGGYDGNDINFQVIPSLGLECSPAAIRS